MSAILMDGKALWLQVRGQIWNRPVSLRKRACRFTRAGSDSGGRRSGKSGVCAQQGKGVRRMWILQRKVCTASGDERGGAAGIG